MSMSPPTIALLAGILLLFIAILGGGITIRDAVIPPLPPLPRVLIALLGAILAVFGAGLFPMPHRGDGPPPPPPAPGYCATLHLPSAPRAPNGVEIYDRLSHGQLYERIDFFVAGRGAGTICVDPQVPQASISIPQGARDASWTARGNEASDVPGGRRDRIVEGSGTIDLSGPNRYSVRARDSTESVENIWLRPF